MNEQEQATFQKLRGKLGIDLLTFSDDLMEMPQLVQEAGELWLDLLRVERASKHFYEVAIAEASDRIRNHHASKDREGNIKPPSETFISSKIPLDKEVQDARVTYDEAQIDTSLAKELHDNLREKSKDIQKTSDMVMAGYITPSSAYAAQRKERMKG